MDASVFTVFLSIVLFIVHFLTRERRSSSKRLPPGSMGVPIIGHSLQMMRAMRSNTAEKWLDDQIKRYGPTSKLNLFGTPTVFITSPAANKFLLTTDSNTLGNQQPQSMQRILGNQNIFELSGDDHKRVRGAMASFLKPEMLKKYVGKMELEVKNHIDAHWRNKRNVTVLPLMKILTFDIICSLLFDMDRGPQRATMINGFKTMIEGMWSIPINLPFTRFNRSLKASTRVRSMVRELIHEKRMTLEKGEASPRKDLITCLLSNGGSKDNQESITQGEIEDNALVAMATGYESSAVLITFFIRALANAPVVYANVVRGKVHLFIVSGKKSHIV